MGIGDGSSEVRMINSVFEWRVYVLCCVLVVVGWILIMFDIAYRQKTYSIKRELDRRQKELARWEWSLEQRESRLHKAGF